MNKKIVLIGFMGAGKSTIGRLLATRLKWGFTDTDEYIETSQGMKISDIFAREGEKAFREYETEALKNLMESDKALVIATGGGIITTPENIDIMKKATVVYLKASGKTLFLRAGKDPTRPLSKSSEQFFRLLYERTPIYEEVADFTFDTESLNASESSQKILEMVEAFT